MTDNLYLLSRLRLVLLSPRATSRADKLSDYAALGAALVGLAQVQRARTALYAAGRRARRRTVEAERKLEELEFWEEVKGGGRRKGGEGDDGDEERREERSRLRDRVREERKRLKELRGEVRESRWERVRLVAEGVFARASPADASLSLLPCPPPLTSLARPVYDALDLERSAESVKSWAGLTASLIECVPRAQSLCNSRSAIPTHTPCALIQVWPGVDTPLAVLVGGVSCSANESKAGRETETRLMSAAPGRARAILFPSATLA